MPCQESGDKPTIRSALNSGGYEAVELSVKEWMIIIGGLLIVAVLLDGYRRVHSERRNRIRVTLSRQALNRGINNPSPVEVAPTVEANPELPNGGARVIDKARRENFQLDDLNLNKSVPVLMESVHIAPEPIHEKIHDQELIAEERAVEIPEHVAATLESTPSIEPEHEEFTEVDLSASRADEQLQTDAVAADEGLLYLMADDEKFSSAAPAAEPVKSKGKNRKYATAAQNHFVEAEKNTPSTSTHNTFKDQPAPAQARPNSSAQEVMIINVLCKDKAGFKGQDLLQILLACDLRFGNMNIFHRYENANGKGPVQFSVANLVEPGIFDLDHLDNFNTPGLCFFLTLPGPEKAITAFNYMVETAQVLVKNLQAEMRDEAHSVMTQQTIEHYRQRIRDFERKQLTLHL